MSLDRISGPVVLDIPTDPVSLFLVRCLVERLSQNLDFSAEEVRRIVLAVDEACSNIIRHACHYCPDERIRLTFIVRPDRLEIEVRDFARPADPKSFMPRSLDEVAPGGLGTHFIRSTMDIVEYELPEDGGMLLKMVKKRPIHSSNSSSGGS